MESLPGKIRAVADARRTIRVYTADPDPTFAAGFDTWNVVVEYVHLPDAGEGFAVVEDETGFVGAMALSAFETFVAPPLGVPGEGNRDEADGNGDGSDGGRYRALLELLQETAFASLDRRQLLATSREIEDRAWRVGRGRLVAGFQRRAALREQASLYRTLAVERGLDVDLYLPASDEAPDVPGTTVHRAEAPELDAVWFVAFDGGGEGQECALLAEERSPGEYYGFWSYEPGTVAELFSYLDRTY